MKSVHYEIDEYREWAGSWSIVDNDERSHSSITAARKAARQWRKDCPNTKFRIAKITTITEFVK